MGPNDRERRVRGSHVKSTGESAGQPATPPDDAAGRRRVNRRRFLAGASALGVGLPGVARAGGTQGVSGLTRAGGTQDADVHVEFRDCVTVEITGDLGAITGLHFYLWSTVDVVDDHLTVEDVGALTPGTTLFDALRVVEHDPGAGRLVVALNTVAYDYLLAADVYLGGKPDFFGDDADVSERNTIPGHVALTDVGQDRGTYADGDLVTADATLANVGEQVHEVFLGYSAVGPDGLARTNDRTTGKPVTLAAGETTTHTVGWRVDADAPAGNYDAHLAVWRESDPDDLRVRYDERYVHGAFSVDR